MGGVGDAVGRVRERFQQVKKRPVRPLDQAIADSVDAVFGGVIDRLHDSAQGWRA
jgi:phosphatidylinositol 3-kinase